MSKISEIKFRDINAKGNHIIRTRIQKSELLIEQSGYSIKLPITGFEHYEVGKKKYLVKPGEFLLVNKNQQLKGRVDSPFEVFSNCIYLDEKLVTNTFHDIFSENIFNEISKDYNFNFYNGNYKIEQDGLSIILFHLSKEHYTDISEEWYQNLAFELLKHQVGIDTLMNKLDITKNNTRQELFFRLNTAKSYIIDSFKEEITIEDISLNACISKFHLIRTFKEVFGETPYNYLTKIRLQKASELINKQTLSLEEIAIETGFKDRQNLSRNFKKRYGLSPSESLL